MVIYDPSKDRSEEYGWKKACDEHVPTEQEQQLWGNITILFGLSLALLVLLSSAI